MTINERLKGAALQLRSLSMALDDIADGRTYNLKAEVLDAFGWFVKIRDNLADIEKLARNGELEPGMETKMPGGTPQDKAVNLFQK